MIRRLNIYRVKWFGRYDPKSSADNYELRVAAPDFDTAVLTVRLMFTVIRLDAVEMILEDVAMKEQE